MSITDVLRDLGKHGITTTLWYDEPNRSLIVRMRDNHRRRQNNEEATGAIYDRELLSLRGDDALANYLLEMADAVIDRRYELEPIA